MHKTWSKSVVASLEREYALPLAEIVQGYFSDGESLASTASILEVEREALDSWCTSHGIQAPRARRNQAKREKTPSSTRAHSVSAWRRSTARISFARLEEMFDVPRDVIRHRYRRTGSIIEAVRK